MPALRARGSSVLVPSIVALVGFASAASAQSGPVFVDAKSNIFGYGLSTPGPGGGGGGILAPTVALTPGLGRTATFFATGQAGWGGALVNGPDGGNFASSTNIPALGPISGFTAPLSGHLVGLFLEAGDISALAAPGTLAYPDAAFFDLPTYAPGLRQVFFIGDGQTTGSATQTFAVPDGAAVLVLGIADAFGFNAAAGYYDDNVGGYDVRYDVVPSPAGLLVLGGLLVTRSRRR